MASTARMFVNSEVIEVFCRACYTKLKLMWAKGEGRMEEEKVEPCFLQ